MLASLNIIYDFVWFPQLHHPITKHPLHVGSALLSYVTAGCHIIAHSTLQVARSALIIEMAACRLLLLATVLALGALQSAHALTCPPGQYDVCPATILSLHLPCQMVFKALQAHVHRTAWVHAKLSAPSLQRIFLSARPIL